jgi:hypothetical protein
MERVRPFILLYKFSVTKITDEIGTYTLKRRTNMVVVVVKVYVVIISQFMIWSGYTFVEWLSEHDQLVYKVFMFFIFYYLAFLLGRTVTKSGSKAFFITSLSLCLYSSVHFTMNYYFLH